MKYLYLIMLTSICSLSINAQEEMKLLGTWTNDSITANSLDARYNEVWGLNINNREYAILGSTEGTHFIDITDPTNPIETYSVTGGTVGSGIIHRDYHDYKGYLYAVSDEGSTSTLQIIDFRDLPNSINVVYDSNDLIRRTHNIFIDSTSARLYSLLSQSANLGYAAMRIFDLENPELPVLIGSYNEFNNYGIGHVHDAYIKNDTAYLNCGTKGFVIVDFIDVDNPNTIAILDTDEYPQSGYNHSGWLTSDGKHYVMADETHGQDMKILDVSNLPDIEVVSTINPDSHPEYQLPHNQLIKGEYLYASYYYDGLQVWDLTDPSSPERTHYYPTSNVPHQKSYHGNWGVYPYLKSGNILASDLQNGLFVLEGFDIDTLTLVNNIVPEVLRLFPNPTKQQLHINVDMINVPSSLIIYNMSGEKIYSEIVASNTSIFSWNIPQQIIKGTYVVKINANGKTYQGQFAIQ